MRKPIIAANWKMYKTADEAKKFCRELLDKKVKNEAETVIFAPFTALSAVSEALKDSNIAIGAQNFYPKAEGAYTGEISPLMLREFRVSYVLVGHSERREIFQENDDLIAQKLQAALKEGFKPRGSARRRTGSCLLPEAAGFGFKRSRRGRFKENCYCL